MKGKHEPGEVGYEFFSRRSGEICREILALAAPKHRTELVLKRVELLREHERFCRDPQVRARFSRVIRYQLLTLVDPQRVFDPIVRRESCGSG